MSDQFFTPASPFGFQLLSSIPKKMAAWIESLSISSIDENAIDFERVEWFFDGFTGHIKFNDVVLRWTGEVECISDIDVSVKELADTEMHIQKFIDFEQGIYGEMRAFSEKLSGNG